MTTLLRSRGLIVGLIAAGLQVAPAVSSAAQADDVAARHELAATGKMRLGLVSAPKANVFFVLKDQGGKPRGVTAYLGDELAATIKVPIEYFIASNSGELTDALEKGAIDVAFLPVDEERRKRVDFGPPYVVFESTCLVLGDSDFKTVGDLDRQNVRIAGEANTTTIRSVARVLKLATIVPAHSVAEAIDMLREKKVDAFALGREALLPYQADIPGSRILDGYFHRTGIAIAVPKSRPAALGYVTTFLERAKASGLIRQTFDKMSLQSTPVAPAE